MSRQIAAYCNRETGLIPELFCVAPTMWAVEAALLTFPVFAPDSIHSKPWLSKNAFMGSRTLTENTLKLTGRFPGIHFDWKEPMTTGKTNKESSSLFLDWLKSRDERVIVGESYLHCYTLKWRSFSLILLNLLSQQYN